MIFINLINSLKTKILLNIRIINTYMSEVILVIHPFCPYADQYRTSSQEYIFKIITLIKNDERDMIILDYRTPEYGIGLTKSIQITRSSQFRRDIIETKVSNSEPLQGWGSIICRIKKI